MSRKGERPRVELTEGAIRVHFHGRVRTITPSAAPPGAEEAADFVVHLDDLVYWDPPDEEIEIEMDDLQKMFEAMDEAFERLGLSLTYE